MGQYVSTEIKTTESNTKNNTVDQSVSQTQTDRQTQTQTQTDRQTVVQPIDRYDSHTSEMDTSDPQENALSRHCRHNTQSLANMINQKVADSRDATISELTLENQMLRESLEKYRRMYFDLSKQLEELESWIPTQDGPAVTSSWTA